MRVDPSALSAQLGKAIPAGLVVIGDELLLREEALDTIRQSAKAQGFTERDVFTIDKQTDFAALDQGAANFSLFASRKIQEYHFSQTPNKDGQQFLQARSQSDDVDTLTVVVLPELKRKEMESVWCRALLDRFMLVPVVTVDVQAFPRWLADRLQREQLTIDAAGREQLLHWFEGNLLACSQLLTQLKLLYGQQPISADEIRNVASENARYQLFDIVDLAFNGDSARVLRMWQGLLAEDGQSHMRTLSGVLARDLQQLAQLRFLLARGESSANALRAVNVWRQRQGPFMQACKRLSVADIQHLLQQLSQIDQALKGVLQHNPARLIEQLLLRIAGLQVAA
ncbi:DNA polymerase III subunit delta [Permianibacter aggregans]|uniref:DNA polymerase III subunit delta n=1 Tax=Permianibacter aggregans TaxID=1510150 RepID=A0A4R6U7C7_9GAMM|nr:DNA polymerase III subunit delta [Permianibacter aggregans]TDQ42428.1 DNA polymerase III delta subunit [Permianibacter aggregans]